MIVELVKLFHEEQPCLLNIMERMSYDYSFIIKAVVFESSFGVKAIFINLASLMRKLLKDGQERDDMASMCLRVL